MIFGNQFATKLCAIDMHTFARGMQFSSAGTILWVTSIGGNGSDVGWGIAVQDEEFQTGEYVHD